MDQPQDARATLERLIADRGDNYADLSRLIGRNAAYIQQFIKRGTPRKLDEDDRRVLARYFGVSEDMLGGGGVRRSCARARSRSARRRFRSAAGAGCVGWRRHIG